MSVLAEFEAPRPAIGDGFTDAITLAFGDLASEVYGTVRLGLAEGRTASGLALLFQGDELVTVAAEGGLEVEDATAWERVSAAGLDVETVEPLHSWRVHFAGEDASLDLEVEATSAPFELEPKDPVARAGGMLGYDQPVRVRGTAELRGRHLQVDALGQRGHSWGIPDWSTIERTRTVAAWFDGAAIASTAIRPAGRDAHGDEIIGAVVFEPGEDLAAGHARVEDPRISTTFDAEGRQQRAALELWVTEDGPPRRAWGEVLCGTTLDLGRLRLDCSFMRWHMDGREGVGRYDVLRRTPDAEPATA
ncbi:MAG TPA: hypothetical protein VII98_05390 [Solirubrobacteraceae bacterium]